MDLGRRISLLSLHAAASRDTGGHLDVRCLHASLKPLVQSPAAEGVGHLSRDQRWVVYESDETEHSELWVTSFPDGGRRWQVTTTGGQEAVWSGIAMNCSTDTVRR